MACGLPVVVTDVSGVRDVVGDAAVKVPVGDARAVADGVERLLSDSDLWQRHRDLGLARARHFTWAAIAEQVRSIYESVA
jgi:glycosyltransferase involved in cell wall biosynthesis